MEKDANAKQNKAVIAKITSYRVNLRQKAFIEMKRDTSQ